MQCVRMKLKKNRNGNRKCFTKKEKKKENIVSIHSIFFHNNVKSISYLVFFKI